MANEINDSLDRREDDMGYSIMKLKEAMKDELVAAEENGEKRGQQKKMESLKRKAKKLEQSGLGADQILKELGLV